MFCCEIEIAKCLINYRYLLMPITMYKLKVATSFKSLYLVPVQVSKFHILALKETSQG